MISYEEALIKANEIIENKYQAVTEVMEFADFWVFLGGAKTKEKVIVGAQNLKIWKNSGKIENFPIPPIDNLKLLDKGVSVFKLSK